MQVTPDAKREILKLLEKKIEADEMWAEAFSKLAGLDESGQNAAVWDLLEIVKSAMRWDELFEKHPEVMERIIENGRKSAEKEGTISLDEFLALTSDDDCPLPDVGQ